MNIRSLSLLIAIITLFSCSANTDPVIAIGSSYWNGKYYINKSYIDAIRENGGRVRLIPCTDDKDLLLEEFKDADAFIFIGGRDYFPHWYGKDMHPTMTVMHEHRASFDSLYIHLAFASGKPMLGICAGEQLMNIATGGKLFRDIPNHRGVEHMIDIKKNSRLHDLFGDSLMVNSWHHQCVDPAYLSDKFKITAMSRDSIVECIEFVSDQWVMGTQFHPEKLDNEQRNKLFKMFINESSK